jgi:hypothetical protein
MMQPENVKSKVAIFLKEKKKNKELPQRRNSLLQVKVA